MHDVNNRISFKDGIPNFPKLVSKGNLYKWLWKNHAIHHFQKDNKVNFNIIVPGIDVVMGTYKTSFNNFEHCQSNFSERVCKNPNKIVGIVTNREILPQYI